MRSLLSILILASCAAAQEAPHSQPTEPEWQSLFDGETLDGWRKAGGKATYAVEDGVIVGTTAPSTPNTFLCTEREYGDFEFEFEFKVDAELNSGVQFRSFDDKNRVRGYQFEIDPSKRSWTSGIYFEGSGWLADLKQNEAARNAFRAGEWNHGRVVCSGVHLRTWLNGVVAADTIDLRRTSGLIGLQVHGVGKRTDPLQVRWRALRIKDHGAHGWNEFGAAEWRPGNGGRCDWNHDRLAVTPGATALCMQSAPLDGDFAVRWRHLLHGPAELQIGQHRIPLVQSAPDDEASRREVWVARVGDRLLVRPGDKTRIELAGDLSGRTPIRINLDPVTRAEFWNVQQLGPVAAAAESGR